MSSSSALEVPFIEVICGYPTREALCCECPALLFLVYEHIVAELQGGRRAYDPFYGTGRQDNLSELLAARSVSEIFERLYPVPPSQLGGAVDAAATAPGETPNSLFWKQARTALEAAWASPYNKEARVLLTQVRGQPHFHFTGPRDDVTPGSGFPLHPVSLERALTTSKRFLRTATTCALDGSTDALKDGQQELRAVLQLARLVPHSSSSTSMQSSKVVTPEGLNFCMVSLQQRWWVLLSAALERALFLARGNGNSAVASTVTKPVLWQLLAVLAVLDTSQYIFAFPDRQQDAAGHHLLARLAEVGLVYPMLSDDRRCFVMSPDFLHALHWHASAPLSLTFTQQLLRSGGGGAAGGGGDVRREDADTIITETNFRLYAYTDDPDLLNILNQFAELEEVVGASLYCYRVTRDSFAAAMRKGITATQVLRFLSLRAHPSMLKRYEERGQPQVASSSGGAGQRRGGRRTAAAAVDAVATLVVPQSFCDQLRMWESECRRVVFEHHVALLRNVSAEQQQAVTLYLTESGEADAIVHAESGYMVLREEVFDRLIAPLLG
ncbi:putative TFIIH basal transcription factor subunit [Leptomonas pyrrhocoris]|uniref:General transcription factor IIH subunit 4 n=1 Tax=Leptomonas pyrrhocoris TaxID=157538 RepID=A0A0M9G0M9_LEPPY|nr:putative TFIIH basal transcription factor subunit [Leptomonas pyrrhocoris]XP_015658385.1 putative TFIIH basal transcription factor subunit [Leptomonas pyrrhocoris]XP_015658386.1 putative TFIIH basal transcription factor subunit [Leptomonas pyrrhocoris]KPA79945.1 putative TFIIH basal transcription factor subunit [Leptomonas pyrrhocoris]KPA79946.1 putative TFIIH basal transcription factor subunit [Leptomonas pyrrhocoris]KPA79947.1 putative TFIIH basal transcription factor subunit [Leptomonas |eukprot:XP_015658384.1 putative TFIIH basal transcription factor subunit [Leptomonas pyrrhocoris]